MVMTTSTSVEANLVTYIVKNLLSKDAIVTFVTDTEPVSYTHLTLPTNREV